MIKQKNVTELLNAIENGEVQLLSGKVFHCQGLAFTDQVDAILTKFLTGTEALKEVAILLDNAGFLYLTKQQEKTLKRKGSLNNAFVIIRFDDRGDYEDILLKVESVRVKSQFKQKYFSLNGVHVVKTIDDVSRLP